jgi:pyruvate dehydrogenase (quinone)
MSQTVADALVDVLEKMGVTHIFGLIADSLNPIGDAVRHSKIEWIGVRHEEGAALAAAGQAKLTGRLGVCCGSTGPGSTHLVAGLYGRLRAAGRGDRCQLPHAYHAERGACVLNRRRTQTRKDKP